MAFNLQTFKTRAITAAIFVVVMLAGLLVNHWTFFVLFSIIHLGCLLEFQKLAGLIYPNYKQVSKFHRYGFIVAGWALIMLFAGEAYSLELLNISTIGWYLLMVLVVLAPLLSVFNKSRFSFTNTLISLVGLTYISLSWAMFINIRSRGILSEGWYVLEDKGYIVPLILISSIWINDTMAYIVGSFIGKTPFSSISPKKTWEGTIGGAVLCVVVVTLGGYYLFGLRQFLAPLIIISLIAAIAGTVGDLLESKVKRMAGVKDSGSIMPGHGGYLDRFDSLLFAVPFVWLYVLIIDL